MNVLTKLLFVFALLIIVVFISLSNNRTIVFDYSEKSELDSKEYSQTASEGISNESTDSTITITSNIVNTYDTTIKTLQSTDTEITRDVSENNTKTYTTNVSSRPSSTVSLDFDKTLSDTSTSLDVASVISSESIYSEIIEFEKAVRRYISKGYKISTLNAQNVKNAGFTTEELSQRYDVTFKLSGDGYDIIITLKYTIPEEIKKELLSNKGISLDGETIRYTFWIKSYR